MNWIWSISLSWHTWSSCTFHFFLLCLPIPILPKLVDAPFSSKNYVLGISPENRFPSCCQDIYIQAQGLNPELQDGLVMYETAVQKMQNLNDKQLQEVYTWVDKIPLSRQKKNISRDFSDGVLLAELVNFLIPDLVQVHNYSSANGVSQKIYNWETLNAKVLKNLGIYLTHEEIKELVIATPMKIESVLFVLKHRIAEFNTPSVRKNTNLAISSARANEGKLIENLEEKRKETPSMKLDWDTEGGISNTCFDEANLESATQRSQSNQNITTGTFGSCQKESRRESEKVELEETVRILQLKIYKMEQLLKIKDMKIKSLQNHKSSQISPF